MTQHPTTLYPDHVGVEPISRFTTALADAAQAGPLDAPVPTCGEWTMADLVWHLTEVQDFWTYIIGARPRGYEHYERPSRPNDPRLIANLRNAVAGLTEVLRSAPASDPAWSWAEEQTVGFSLRRQTHEALTHCVDALLVAGLPLPEVTPELAADGIDEVVHIMIKPSEPAATGTVTLQTTDTGDSWTVAIGEGDATIVGKALDLNLWLWGRSNTWPLSITGATNQVAALRNQITGDTQ